MPAKPHYRTWIRTSKIIQFWILTLGALSLGLLGLFNPWLSCLALLSLPFGYISLIISLTAWRFGPHGGDFQNRVHQLIINSPAAEGSTLDIGCGSARLIIKLAQLHPNEQYSGLDYWGSDWEYSRELCRENARIEGVGSIDFVQGSAAHLPFADASFDHIVSCLTFHEVAELKDKCQSLNEALRVLKPNGTFAFLDLFDDTRIYPDPNKIIAAINQAGGTIVDRQKLSQILKLPFPLNSPRALRHGVLITGRKQSARASNY